MKNPIAIRIVGSENTLKRVAAMLQCVNCNRNNNNFIMRYLIFSILLFFCTGIIYGHDNINDISRMNSSIDVSEWIFYPGVGFTDDGNPCCVTILNEDYEIIGELDICPPVPAGSSE